MFSDQSLVVMEAQTPLSEIQNLCDSVNFLRNDFINDYIQCILVLTVLGEITHSVGLIS